MEDFVPLKKIEDTDAEAVAPSADTSDFVPLRTVSSDDTAVQEQQAQAVDDFVPLASMTEQPLEEVKEQPKSIGLGGQFAFGAKESLLPLGITKAEEESAVPTTGGEIAARVTGNLVTDVVTNSALVWANTKIGAAIGAAIGGPAAPGTAALGGAIGAVGTTIALALYHGYGNAKIMAEMEDKGVDPLYATMNVASELVPLVKFAPKFGGKIGKAVAMGGLSYASAKYVDVPEPLALGAAAVGGTVAGLTNKAGLDLEKIRATGVIPYFSTLGLPPKAMASVAEELSKEDTALGLARGAVKILERDKDALAKRAAQVSLADAAEGDLQVAELRKLYPDTELETMALAESKLAKANGEKIDYEESLNRAAKEMWTGEMLEFAHFLLPKSDSKGKTLIKEAAQAVRASGHSEQQAWDQFTMQKTFLKAMEEASIKESVKLGLKDPANNVLWRVFGEPARVYESLERMTGLPLVKTYLRQITATNRHQAFMYSVKLKLNSYIHDFSKADRNLVVEAIESGKPEMFSKLTPAGQKALDKVRAQFAEIRKYGRSLGVDIGMLDPFTYVHKTSKPDYKIIPQLEKNVQKYGAKTILSRGRDIEKAVEEGAELPEAFLKSEVVDTARVLRRAYGKPLQSAEDIDAALQILRQGSAGKGSLGFESSAAFKRHNMPELVRERDIARIMIDYAEDVGKSAVMTPVITEMSTFLPVLNALGFRNFVKWQEKAISDASERPGTFRSWTNTVKHKWKLAYEDVAQNDDSGVLKRMGAKAMAIAPDLTSYLLSNLYGSYLGWRLDKVVRNLQQPVLFTAPELGGSLGYELAARASVKTLRDLAAPGKKSFTKVLNEEGLFPGGFVGESYTAFQDGLSETLPLVFGKIPGTKTAAKIIKALPLPEKIANKVGPVSLDDIAQVGMSAYSYADVVNRYISRHMARDFTDLVFKNDKRTVHFLKSLTPGLKAEFDQLYKSKNVEGFKQLLTQYLTDKTQMSYNRAAMNQFGREYGQFVTMFTKMPVATISDMASLIKNKQYMKFSEKYLATLGLMVGLQWAFRDADSLEMNPRKKYFFGESWIKNAPITTAAVGMPPMAKMVGAVGSAGMRALNGDLRNGVVEYMETNGKQLKDAFQPTLPLYYGIKKGAEQVYWNLYQDEEKPQED